MGASGAGAKRLKCLGGQWAMQQVGQGGVVEAEYVPFRECGGDWTCGACTRWDTTGSPQAEKHLSGWQVLPMQVQAARILYENYGVE